MTAQQHIPATDDFVSGLAPITGGPFADVGPTREPLAQRIVATLEACASKKGAMTLGELVKETGLAKTTVHRTC